MSNYNLFSRESNDIKIFEKQFHSVEKNRFEFFDLRSNFELISKGVNSCNSSLKRNLKPENLVLLN